MFFFEYAPKNNLTQGVNKIFIDENLHGLTDKNKYNQVKHSMNDFQGDSNKIQAPVMPYQHEQLECKEKVKSY